MTPTWVARLPMIEAACAARLRIDPNIRAAEDDGYLWLCASGIDDVDTFRHRLPEACLFDVLVDGQLVPKGARVPTDRLPKLNWGPLSAVLPVETPIALHAGRPQTRRRIMLVTSSVERTPDVLVTSLETWAMYAVTAPEVRLKRWQFAAKAATHSVGRTSNSLASMMLGTVTRDREQLTDGLENPSCEVVIRGEPLPPLRGQRYTNHTGLACPIGWTWSPAIDAQVIREILGSDAADLALMEVPNQSPQSPEGRGAGGEGEPQTCVSWTIIESRNFVQATRSAVRASLELMRHE